MNIIANAVDPDEVCDPGHPIQTARRLVAVKFTDGTQRTFHRHRGTFWHWDGACYREVSTDACNDTIWKFLEHAKRLNDEGRLVAFKPTRDKVGNVREALASVGFIGDATDPPFWLHDDAELLPANEFFACANGLLHVPSGKLLPPTPDFFGVTASTVTYDPNAPEPVQWLAFLDQVLVRRDSIQLQQEWFGYSLTPDTSQHKMMLALGPPRSGKGTMARIQTALLGSASVAGPSMGSLGTPFGLQELITKALAIISDARIGAKTDKAAVAERLLNITGDDGISVQRKFLTNWFGKLPTRLMVLTNELPTFAEGSGALANRFLILLFLQSFLGKEDPGLTGKLLPELSGILNWAIAGYRSLKARGHFIQPRNALEKIRELEMLGAPVKAFVRDCCVVEAGKQAEKDALWVAWRNWCEKTGRQPGTKDWFLRDVGSAFPHLKTRRLGPRDGHRAPHYDGIGIVHAGGGADNQHF